MTTADAPAVSFSSAPGRWVVAVTVLGSGIAALDATVVSIALPSIGHELHHPPVPAVAVAGGPDPGSVAGRGGLRGVRDAGG